MTPRSDNAIKVARMMERPSQDTVRAVLVAFVMGSPEARSEIVELIVVALQTRGEA